MSRTPNNEQLGLNLDGKRRRRRRHVPDTSRAAEQRVKNDRTGQLRTQILAAIVAAWDKPSMRGATADEVHEQLAANQEEVADVRRLMEIRRRVSDLHRTFKEIADTGVRRMNSAGNLMIVWGPVGSTKL